jgi:hypothetical protein
MKTRILFFILALVFSNVTFAGIPSAVVEGPRTIVVKPREWKAARIYVEIINEEGETLVSQPVRTIEKSRKYNLKNLPAGNYVLRMSDDLKVFSRNFTLDADGVTLSGDLTVEYKPVVKSTDTYLDVNFFTQGKPATISILDHENNVVYRESFERPAIHKRFDISRFGRGNYSVLCESAGKSYINGFAK